MLKNQERAKNKMEIKVQPIKLEVEKKVRDSILWILSNTQFWTHRGSITGIDAPHDIESLVSLPVDFVYLFILKFIKFKQINQLCHWFEPKNKSVC